MGCKLYHGFGSRGGIEAPHSFALKMRRDLTRQEINLVQKEPAPTALFNHLPVMLDDAFCCIKTYTRSLELQQAPMLVIPAGNRAGLQLDGPAAMVALKPMGEKEIETLLVLASLCEEHFKMPAAAIALRRLALKREYTLPGERWLPSPANTRAPAAAGANPFFPHLPETSWRLLIKPA